MTFEEVAVRIGLPEIQGPFTRGWEESERAYPDAGPPFLDDEHIPSGFPELSQTAIEGAPAFNVLVALSAVPDVLSFYGQHRIPSTVLHDTLSDFAIWVRYYRERLGYTGINVRTVSWLRFHLHGRTPITSRRAAGCGRGEVSSWPTISPGAGASIELFGGGCPRSR